MASLIQLRWDITQDLVQIAAAHGQKHDVPAVEMAVALMNAGLVILSSGMDEAQVRLLFEQGIDATAPLRAETAERWKRTGFPGGVDGGGGTQ